MTKIKFKYDNLNKNVIPKINDIISNLNDLKNITNNMDIPQNFLYYNYLKSINDKMELWINNYQKINDNIEKINHYLDIDQNNINEIINNINEIDNK